MRSVVLWVFMVSLLVCGKGEERLLTIVGPSFDTLADWSFNVSNV